MRIIPGAVWGLITARGGSKTMPLKNLTPFVGRPLIDFQILAARSSGSFGRILCSTEHQAIAARCETLGIEVHPRPGHLGADNTPVMDVVADLLADINEREGAVAECIALLRPTSPFLLTEHIRWSVNALLADGGAGSAQTAVPCPENHDAVQQQIIDDGVIKFRFAAERAAVGSGQKADKHFVFGNFLVFRSLAALAQRTPFAQPSIPIEIPFAQGFKLSRPDDVKLGQALLAAGLAALPNS